MIESKQVLAWQNEAVLRASRTLMRELLQKRFGVVPESVLERIEAATDPERLRAALLEVLDLKKPEELQL